MRYVFGYELYKFRLATTHRPHLKTTPLGEASVAAATGKRHSSVLSEYELPSTATSTCAGHPSGQQEGNTGGWLTLWLLGLPRGHFALA